MVNCASELLQLFCEPDTVMVAVISDVVLLMAVKAGRLPVPLAASPMDGLLFVQVNTVPFTGLVKATGCVVPPLQISWLRGVSTSGVGFTVIV